MLLILFNDKLLENYCKPRAVKWWILYLILFFYIDSEKGFSFPKQDLGTSWNMH